MAEAAEGSRQHAQPWPSAAPHHTESHAAVPDPTHHVGSHAAAPASTHHTGRDSTSMGLSGMQFTRNMVIVKNITLQCSWLGRQRVGGRQAGAGREMGGGQPGLAAGNALLRASAGHARLLT